MAQVMQPRPHPPLPAHSAAAAAAADAAAAALHSHTSPSAAAAAAAKGAGSSASSPVITAGGDAASPPTYSSPLSYRSFFSSFFQPASISSSPSALPLSSTCDRTHDVAENAAASPAAAPPSPHPHVRWVSEPVPMSVSSEDEAVSPTRAVQSTSPGRDAYSQSPKATSDHDGNRSEVGASGSGFLHSEDKRTKRKRKPSPPELLVIVRPPPASKDRNPLNLQIQLVLPQAPPAQSNGRTSGESSRDTASNAGGRGADQLRRRNSSSSTRSGRSEVTTASSSSYGGGGSSARRVTPLYNLSIHSILPTTISDAGTDQRVAKYSKKGVEIDGFGVLEPSELLHGINDLASLEATGVIPVASPGVVSPSRGSTDGEPTSDPGVVSAGVEPPTSFDSMTPEAQSPDGHLGAKFMRRFKGLSLNLGRNEGGGGPAASIAAASTAAASAKPSFTSFLSNLSSGPKVPRSATVAGPEAAAALSPSRPLSSAGLTIATAGPNHHQNGSGNDVTQMVPGAGLSESGRRTQGYYWTVKRYNRRVTDSNGQPPRMTLGSDGQNPVLKNVWRRFNSVNRLGGEEKHPHPSDIPVRFEWTRESRSHNNSSAAAVPMMDAAGKRLSTGSMSLSPTMDQRVGRRASLRPPTGRKTSSSQGHGHSVSRNGRSQSSSARVSLDQNGGGESAIDDYEGDDDGNASDPEDSETPWSCHLVLGASTRIPIGTLSPAPHHPKLVAQLAVPFPLPDLSQTGLGADGAGLTREEIKDVICVTCLHLIIRESFGGLGRVRRRGDRV